MSLALLYYVARVELVHALNLFSCKMEQSTRSTRDRPPACTEIHRKCRPAGADKSKIHRKCKLPCYKGGRTVFTESTSIASEFHNFAPLRDLARTLYFRQANLPWSVHLDAPFSMQALSQAPLRPL